MRKLHANLRETASKFSCKIVLSILAQEGVHTLPVKSLILLASIYSKTTLNTGGVDGTGVDPQT